ncbi:transmembrane amino acid transporter protein-domain-containing protein [Dichomitus squalens]|uniref:Transmembrane amino acid transporter protein-domain-containing protein n=1 Tax=Dichomitus squalens TaxID=114155 RepID=A0A4Q9PBI7_9APHY|nr:transmembrane amino acid transporter protein-domain-containing protein [Dichomitus squalens]TBU65399.1 transmembrane amino acid transporter protein-domain-containing protein [Dichomitus squalens]
MSTVTNGATSPRATPLRSGEKRLTEKRGHAEINANVVHVREEGFDVYGEEDGNAQIKYRTMVWWKAAALMLAETVSLGILSIPSVFASIGMVAGCILVIGLGIIATATGYVIGSFKLRYPHVHNMADAGEILAGPIGREILGAAQVIFIIFLCGSHVLTGLIAFDTITNGASCSVVWAAVTAIICFLFTLPRTLDGISYLSVVSFISIISAIFITMIGVGVAGHQGTVAVTSHLAFAPAFLAVTDIIFAYAGHVAFFTFIAEMKEPEDFPKALYALQITDTTLYLIVGIVVYAYTGANTVSPALGNTGVTLRKVAYGIALPTIIIAGVINGHVCAKLIFIRIFRRKGVHSRHMTSHSWTGWLTWAAICTAIWALAFVIAEVIPFFNDLLGVISSLFAAWFTYGISGIFWFHMTPRSERWTTARQKANTIFWSGIILMGAFIMVGGLYASIQSILDGYRNGGFPGPFTCANQGLV